MINFRRIVPILTLFSLAVLGWYSILFSRADAAFRDNTLASLRTAVELAPSSAAYHELLAEHLETAGQNPDLELKIATDLSPRESRYWIRRAFRAELEQKYQESEDYLLRARSVDRGFDPRWALMNFYFRRNKLSDFWRYTRESLDMSYGNLSPIFRLCLAANGDPAATQQILPPRRDILFSFFVYLLNQGRLDYAAKVADELSLKPQGDEAPALINYCGKRMTTNPNSALRVWNRLCAARLLPFGELAPEQGRVTTNGDFAIQPARGGFDWKYSADPTISITPSDTGQGLLIDLSASQADNVALIEQEIPLTPGNQYAIRYTYRLAGPADDSGLHWAIFPTNTDSGSVDELMISPVLVGQDWQNGKLTFLAERDAVRLVLVRRRTLGTVRWKGTVQLRNVTSALAQPRPDRN